MWYALAALAGIEGVWLLLLAARFHALQGEIEDLERRLSGGSPPS